MKILFYAAAFFILLGCRTEELASPEQPKYFETLGAVHHEDLNYGQAFRTLYQKRDSINASKHIAAKPFDAVKNAIDGKMPTEYPYIDWRVRSQPLFMEGDEVWVLYPVIAQSKVTAIAVVRLYDGRQRLELARLSPEADGYAGIMRKMEGGYGAITGKMGKKAESTAGMQLNRSCNTDFYYCPIESIDIIVTQPKPRGGYLLTYDFYDDGGPGGEGGCGDFNDCGPPLGPIGGGQSPKAPRAPKVNPCDRVKAILSKHAGLADVIKELNNWNGTFEKGYKFSKTSSTPIETPKGPDNHSVMVGNLNEIYGFFHTHPNIPMFSATDINNLVEMLRYNSGSSLQDYFVGVKGPEGSIYMISFNGNFSDVQNLPYCDVSDTNNFDDEMLKDYSNLISLSTNYLTPDRKLNFEGQMILFQNAIMYLGLTNKVNLSKLEINNGQIFTKNITNLNTNPTPENCN